jgi:hypothetical protein
MLADVADHDINLEGRMIEHDFQRKGRESNPQGSSLARLPSGSRLQSGSPSRSQWLVVSGQWSVISGCDRITGCICLD